MSTYDYDLIVIGGGSGGVRAARISAGYGARVAIFEDNKWGGTCVNVGCVPKKLFVYSSRYAEIQSEAESLGWSFEQPTFSWQTLKENKDKEIARLNGIYKKLLAKCDIIEETASLQDEHTVVANNKQYTSQYILIATGSTPMVPDVPGKEHILVSDDLFHLESLPKTILINGGGYIGVEFSNIFHGFGVKVIHVYRGDLFLRGFDKECRELLAGDMKERGIDLRFRTNITSMNKNADGLMESVLTDGSTVVSDAVLFTTGRIPKVDGLNLEALGIEQGKGGSIVVDEFLKTNVGNIYAIGDVIDKVNLTPVALNQGHALADTLFGNQPRMIDLENIATAVFSQPALGHCGILEEDARQQLNNEVDIYKSSFTPMKYSLGDKKHKTFYKLIVDRKTQKVIGAHLLDLDAGEMIQTLGICIKAGLTKQQFDSVIGVHPTSAEELVTMRTKASD